MFHFHMRLTLVLYQHSIDIQINMTENKEEIAKIRN